MDVSPDNVFISSSIQALLTRLAMFFKSKNSYNSFIIENLRNKEASSIFQSLGYHAQTYRVLPDGHQISEIPNKKSLLYVHAFTTTTRYYHSCEEACAIDCLGKEE
ncbi:hypothetical protein KZO01_25520 [Kurthia zopfii]|nr:hypothetical protein KZO01_25520 [Kurthia zopfii]